MLLKAALNKRLQANKLINTSARTMITFPEKNFIVPESVNDLVKFMDMHKPTFTCVYFHAAWNPICEKIDYDYEKFCSANAAFTHVKVDCDATPKLKLFFDARVEP